LKSSWPGTRERRPQLSRHPIHGVHVRTTVKNVLLQRSATQTEDTRTHTSIRCPRRRCHRRRRGAFSLHVSALGWKAADPSLTLHGSDTLGPIGMHNRMFAPYLAAIGRSLCQRWPRTMRARNKWRLGMRGPATDHNGMFAPYLAAIDGILFQWRPCPTQARNKRRPIVRHQVTEKSALPVIISNARVAPTRLAHHRDELKHLELRQVSTPPQPPARETRTVSAALLGTCSRTSGLHR
jgi:hypothetical protein